MAANRPDETAAMLTGDKAADRWIALPAEQRDKEIEDSFREIRRFSGQRRHREEHMTALKRLSNPVGLNQFAHVNDLAALSSRVIAHKPANARVAALSEEELEGFWGVQLDQTFQRLDPLQSQGKLSGEDYLYRVASVEDRVYNFAKNYLSDRGWDDEFSEALLHYHQHQLHLAATTPAGQPLPETVPEP